MNILTNILKWTQIALAGVAIAQQVRAADAGKTKQQFVLDLINGEGQLANAVAPSPLEQLIQMTIVNLAVTTFNLAGLFPHKGKPAQSGVLAPVVPTPTS